MTWFHGAFPHPLAPSRKGRGDFLEPLKMSKLQAFSLREKDSAED
jgi:hypothetical protein